MTNIVILRNAVTKDLEVDLLFFEIGDYVGDGLEGGEGLVRNHNSVLILDAHQQLEDVQGVRPQVFLDEGLGSDFGGVQTKLLRQDGLYFFKHKIRFRCPVGPGMTF